MLKITHLSHSKFVANKNVVTLDFFNWLEKKIPEIQNSQFVYDPTETFSVGSDFTMVLAGGIGYDRYFRFDFIKKKCKKIFR